MFPVDHTKLTVTLLGEENKLQKSEYNTIIMSTVHVHTHAHTHTHTRSVWNKPSHRWYNQNGLHSIDVTWRPRRVDWNARAWTMATSQYQLVGGGRCHWVSMCTVGPHSKWLSRKRKESAPNFSWSLNIPPWKLFRRVRRLQLWAAGDWKLHHNNAPAHASRLMQNSLAKHQIIQLIQPPYSPDLVPCDSGFSQNENHPWKERYFRLWDSGKYDGATGRTV